MEKTDYKIHPLVLMNISDHFTRIKYRSQEGHKVKRAFGMLLGKQVGDNIEIENSVELANAQGHVVNDAAVP
jgi:COP9 signalosome complex subunit 6